MARRKTRRATRRTFFSAPKRRKSTSSVNNKAIVGTMVAGATYGAGREYLSNLVDPITQKFAGQLGTYADEIVLTTVHYLGVKNIKNPMLKRFFMSGLTLESARVGAKLASGFGTQQTTNNNIVVVG